MTDSFQPNDELDGSQSDQLAAVAARAYTDRRWWQQLGDKAARNAVQTVIPVLIAATAGSVHGYDAVQVLVAVAGAALVTVLKALAQLATGRWVGTDAPLVLQLADRAIPAAAASLLTFATLDGTNLATSVDWRAALVATVGAALLAVAQRFVSPPKADSLTLAA